MCLGFLPPETNKAASLIRREEGLKWLTGTSPETQVYCGKASRICKKTLTHTAAWNYAGRRFQRCTATHNMWPSWNIWMHKVSLVTWKSFGILHIFCRLLYLQVLQFSVVGEVYVCDVLQVGLTLYVARGLKWKNRLKYN